MTIASTVTKKIYDADGVTRDWPITMETSGISSSEIKVYLVDEDGVSTLVTANYDVDLTALSVEYPTVVSGLDPIASPNKILLVRELALTQPTDYKNQGDVPAETIEEALDRLTEVAQQQQEQIDRSFKADISQDKPDLETFYTALNAAKTAAETAQGLAEDAQAGAETAQGLAEDAQAGAETAQGLAEDAQTAAEAAASSLTYASQAEAEAGTEAAKMMSPLRTAQAIAALADSGVAGDGTVNPTNLLSNGNFESWSAGTTSAPDGWTFGGAGASIARESTTIKIGTYSAKLTRAGTDCNISQEIYTEKGINYWKGRKVTFGCWVYATVASRAYLYIYDDVSGYRTSTAHTGDSTWQWITLTTTINTSATLFRLLCVLAAGDTSAYFDGAMLVEGSSAFAFAPKPEEVTTYSGWLKVKNSAGTDVYIPYWTTDNP